jgi:hypothetical protein
MNLNLNLKNLNIINVFLILILLFVLINIKSVFNSILGRLLVIFVLIGVTSYNMLAGLVFVLILMIMNNHFSNDYEGMENPEGNHDASQTDESSIKQKISAQMASLSTPTTPSPPTPNIEPPSTTDVAEKERKIVTGNQSNSLPIHLNKPTEDVIANNPDKEGFMSYASIY